MTKRARFERILAVVGAAALLVVGFDSVTYAATGSSLLLGRVNQAGGVTTVKNTSAGAALSLLTRSSASAPFTTNARGLVTGLYAARAANSDKVGGKTLAQVTASLTQATFHPVATSAQPIFGSLSPVFNGGFWANYPGFGPVGYRKDASGVVTLTGLMCPFNYIVPSGSCSTGPTLAGGYVTAFTLPAGFRPASRLVFSVVDTDRAGRLDVLPNGDVQFDWTANTIHGYVSLDGVSFRAGG
jgi:hypothetical protein